jgi:hypothetical protein
MSAKEIAKFEHILTLFGVGSAFQLLCSHNSIITHRKMKGKMKDMHDLEYPDPASNTLKKLSEEELDEVKAFQPFMNALQNETGPIKIYPIGITKYSRDDFICYQEDSYDSDNPSQYNYAMSLIAEKHNKEMEKLAATTANVMATTGGTTTTANLSGGGSSGGSSGGGTSSGGGIIPPDDPLKAEMKALSKAAVPDPKQFVPLKHDDDYATWLKGFLNTATIQGFEKLLKPLYVPNSPEEQKIFDLRQKHLYNILTKILLTSKSVDLLRNHVSDTDAQKVLSELHTYQTDSVIASRRKRECLEVILAARINPNQNIEDQIVAFKESLRTYKSKVIFKDKTG